MPRRHRHRAPPTRPQRWEHLGFHPFHPDEPTDTDLYLLTTEIGATLGALK